MTISDPAETIRVQFTPWGEALSRSWYQQALIRLTALPHVRRAAVQTNLSCRLDWTRACDRSRLGLWCTFHPGQTSRERFLGQCRELDLGGVRYSVGVVGLREHLPDIAHLRAALPERIYLWVNAYKRVPGYYSPEERARITAIDPLFPFSDARHPSLGRACAAGRSVVAVDGEGTIRRCHFIDEPMGNLYDADLARTLAARPCTRASCDCHIGYVYLEELHLSRVFGDGLLERIPEGWRSSWR